MKDRKGQAAMEFLMTYGWAILAAIIVIAVISIYFRPSALVQNSVVVNAPLYGVGTTIAAGQIQIEVRNNGGETITVTGATLSFNSPSGAVCSTLDGGSGVLDASGTTVLDFGGTTACTGLTAGDTVNGDVTVSYTRPDSTLTLQSTGSLSGKVA